MPNRVRSGQTYRPFRLVLWAFIIVVSVSMLWLRIQSIESYLSDSQHGTPSTMPYGHFPKRGDPFSFIPCTNATVQPALEDPEPKRSWTDLFDRDPKHWIWGKGNSSLRNGADGTSSDLFHGRGIFLCGYLDVPLDYTNSSDTRIVRLAVTKLQVSGLAPLAASGSFAPPSSSAGRKSERTIVVQPGGPGGSGTSFAFLSGEKLTERLSDGQFDVLGWDPRGVNMSQPALSCYPSDAEQDRWSLLTTQSRREVGSPVTQLARLDAMNDAIFRACVETHGDFPRFVSTASVVRDMEEIRKALGEDELTGYLVSYGTNIGQTYANMFPSHVGRIILDGVINARGQMQRGGFGWNGQDNVTDAWREGFLGECVRAGPEHCALAKLIEENQAPDVALSKLQQHVEAMVSSLIERPIPGYTKSGGPSLITYSTILPALRASLYNARTWPALSQMLFELDSGNSTLAAALLDEITWRYHPTAASMKQKRSGWDELFTMVVCSDAFDAPLPADPIDWYDGLWLNMTQRSWIDGDACFFNVFPCLRFGEYWQPAEVYRGDLNNTLKHPILLISETHDPATPLRNGRELLAEMGPNARLIVHYGYGHSSVDRSKCTDEAARVFIMEGTVPTESETACFADEKPYMYTDEAKQGHIEVWAELLANVAV